jgi:hypothetical protein
VSVLGFGPEDEDEVDEDEPEDEVDDGWESDYDEHYDADDFPQTDEEWEEACRDPDTE